MFEKEFTIKLNGVEEKLTLKPLTGKYIGKFYKVLGGFSKAEGKDEKEFLSLIDEEILTSLHTLAVVTLEKSYPARWTPEDLDSLVSRHLLLFLEPVIKLNTPQE